MEKEHNPQPKASGEILKQISNKTEWMEDNGDGIPGQCMDIELNKIYNESCCETMRRMESKSIDCVITSPPYWQLRDYGYEGQWGLEPTYQEYLEHLWSMMDEVWRVLKPMGTVWINLGDTYARGSRGKDGTNHSVMKKSKEHHIEPLTKPDYQGQDKCLLLLPHRFAIGCMDRGWIVRNDIIWAKRNGMPESVRDRFSKKHEYMFFMVKQERYYFDLDAVREKTKTIEKRTSRIAYSDTKIDKENAESYGSPRARKHRGQMNQNVFMPPNTNGKNPGSVSDFWDIPTKPSNNKHFAMYNDVLITKPILAGCPVGGIIYDPFAGTGTTIACAMRAKRYGIGSEMSKEFCNIFEKNIFNIKNQECFL